MAPDSPDPTVIRALAVTAEDVVAAVEMRTTSDRDAVLRVTPPFSGRMRARLHVATPGEYDGDTPRPVHVDPETLLGADAPSYPRPEQTEDELRADPDVEYTVEHHHEYHTERVNDWRNALPAAIGNTATIETPDGPHEVSISVLGRPEGES